LCTTRQSTLLASGIADGGSQLGDRIALLLRRGREFTPRASMLRVSLCTGALLVFAVATSRAPAWMAFAQTPAPRATSADLDQDVTPPTPPPAASPRREARRAAPAPPAPALAAPADRAPMPPPPPAPILAPAGNSLLAALVANGYGDLPVDEIVDLKNQGVSPGFIQGMAHSGIGKLPPKGLIELRQQGVRPEYVHDILALGFGPYTTRQLIDFKNRDVSVELFRAIKEYGLMNADPREIIEAKTQGVGAGSFREAQKYSPNLTMKQIIRLKQAGVI
jgi:hypothetical protein